MEAFDSKTFDIEDVEQQPFRPDAVDAPPGCRTCAVLAVVLLALGLFATLLISIAPQGELPGSDKYKSGNLTYPVIPGDHAFAITIALSRQTTMQSGVLVLISFFAVVGSTVASAVVVTFSPQLAPLDFQAKGTLSNVAQDVATPHGRLFTVTLFTAGIVQLFSMYTFWLYRPWAPLWKEYQNPWRTPAFEPSRERFWRILWVTLPHVGLMFSAALPSFSDTEDLHKFAVMIVHNMCAPLSMAACIIMETVQLAYGEGAFKFFFAEQVPSSYSVLTVITRLRVMIVVYAWGAGLLFFGMQVYWGLRLLGVKVRTNTNYSLALLSFYAEVLGMIFAFALPALVALESIWDPNRDSSIMDEIAWRLANQFEHYET